MEEEEWDTRAILSIDCAFPLGRWCPYHIGIHTSSTDETREKDSKGSPVRIQMTCIVGNRAALAQKTKSVEVLNLLRLWTTLYVFLVLDFNHRLAFNVVS